MKKFACLLLPVTIFLFISGCGGQDQLNQTNTAQTSNNQNNDVVNEINEPGQSASELEVAIKEESLNRIQDTENLNKALTGNLKIQDCESIKDQNMKNFCIKDIITTQAYLDKDIAKCDGIIIEEDRQYCLDKVKSTIPL